MSTNLTTLKGNANDIKDIRITSFNGGVHGQMLQLHNGYGMDAQIIQMTEAQVKQAMITMATWMAEQS